MTPNGQQDDSAAVSILRRRDKALGQIISEVLGEEPILHVLTQHRVAPPYPAWVAPPLDVSGTLLIRCTAYRRRDEWLSRNMAYVDLSAVDSNLGRQLENQEVNLGQIFGRPDIDKSEFELGSGDLGDMQSIFDSSFPTHQDRFVWRRYTAAISGRPTFAVAEALPVAIWQRLIKDPIAREDRL